MILSRNHETGYWTEGPDGHQLKNVHDPMLCMGRACAIHNRPSNHRLKKAPLNWRVDRGILERICVHNIGHPDADAALYHESIGQGVQNVHGCCGYGCCAPI